MTRKHPKRVLREIDEKKRNKTPPGQRAGTPQKLRGKTWHLYARKTPLAGREKAHHRNWKGKEGPSRDPSCSAWNPAASKPLKMLEAHLGMLRTPTRRKEVAPSKMVGPNENKDEKIRMKKIGWFKMICMFFSIGTYFDPTPWNGPLWEYLAQPRSSWSGPGDPRTVPRLAPASPWHTPSTPSSWRMGSFHCNWKVMRVIRVMCVNLILIRAQLMTLTWRRKCMSDSIVAQNLSDNHNDSSCFSLFLLRPIHWRPWNPRSFPVKIGFRPINSQRMHLQKRRTGARAMHHRLAVTMTISAHQ